jgi:type II secretory pathway component GspD/PulD (secretin)
MTKTRIASLMLLFCFVLFSRSWGEELKKGPVKQFRADQQTVAESASAPDKAEMETFYYKSKNYQASFLAETVKLLLSPYGVIQSNDDLNVIIVTDKAERISSVKDMLVDVDELPQQIIIQAKVLKINSGAVKSAGINLASIFDHAFAQDTLTQNTHDTSNNTDRVTHNVNDDVDYGDTDESNVKSQDNYVYETADKIRTTVMGYDYYPISDLVNYLVTNDYASVNSEPKIVTMNNKTGKVFIGDRIKILRNYNYVAGGDVNAGQHAEDLEEESGLILEVTPHIGESNFITMDIKTGFGSIYSTSSNSVRSKVSEAVSSVIVKSGEPIIIGGYKTQEKSDTKNKMPVLGDIPILKNLFSKKDSSVTDVEMVIILVPEIVKPGTGFKSEDGADKK